LRLGADSLSEKRRLPSTCRTHRCTRLHQLVHFDDGGDDPERDTIPIAAVARELGERKVRLLDLGDAALPPYDFVAAYPRDSQTHITATVAAIAREVARHGTRPIRTTAS
jgi:hypothetical protein